MTEENVKIANIIPNNNAAAIFLIEHIWAKDLKQALRDAHGYLIADGIVHRKPSCSPARRLGSPGRSGRSGGAEEADGGTCSLRGRYRLALSLCLEAKATTISPRAAFSDR